MLYKARLVGRDGKKLDKFDIGDETTAHAFRDAIKGQLFKVESIEAKDHKRHPAPPFTTSSLLAGGVAQAGPLPAPDHADRPAPL